MRVCYRRHVSVGVLVFDIMAGTEYCLFGFKLSHPSGFVGWEFPGGKVEPNETVEFAAIREVCEETGLIIKPTYLGCYVETENYICMMFGAVPIDGELKLEEPDKHREWKWFPCNQFPSPLMPYVKDALQAIAEVT